MAYFKQFRIIIKIRFFATNSNFLISISLQPDGLINPLIFRPFDLTEFLDMKYQRSTTSGCKDTWEI